jgi:phytoene dehydrogenase-like protein
MSETLKRRGGRSMIVIGAGIAGLSAGCYAQMNGYRSRVFEMHTQPGGLCTAWQRKGYTIDYCIHWLSGSKPGGSMYRLWEEIGLAQGLELVDLDEFYRYEAADGRTVILYRDLDRTEKYLCELSPADEPLLREFFGAARKLVGKDMMADVPPRQAMGPLTGLSLLPRMLPYLRPFRKWGRLTLDEVAGRFHDPLLAAAFRAAWPPQSAAIVMIITFAWLHEGSAAYPIGGSLPLARSVERRYVGLGGEVKYGARVDEILVEGGRAVGVRLADGSEERADVVLSAADGHATIYGMLGGRYVGEVHRDLYERDVLPLFSSLLFVGVGVARSFAGEPQVMTGIDVPLIEPLAIGERTYERLHARIHNFDPTLAPEGKTAITCAFEADEPYWAALRAADPGAYAAEKQRVTDTVVRTLDRRYPGLAAQVEMTDVSTPATLVRYTGNWQGSFEGWLPTPEWLFKQVPRTLPGLDGFWMVGQWVAPGGGLPSGPMSARQVQQLICKRDGVKFRTSVV